MSREERMLLVLSVAGSAALLVFVLAPFAYMTVTALAARADFLAPGVAFEPTLANLTEIVFGRSLRFMHYLRNSLIVSAVSAAITVVVAALAAYAITRLDIRGRTAILLAVLALSMFPQVSIVGYLYRVMTRARLINTYLALILPYIAWVLPLSLWIMVSYLAQIPRDLDKAARIDGCSHWQTLVKVILPVAAPGLVSTVLLAFIFCFNEFMFALMLTTDHRSRTVPVGIALFQGLHGETPWGKIMAASVVTTVPIVVLTLLFQRRIVSGLTRGAVKG